MTEKKKHPWLDEFWKNPVDAIGKLLSGQFYMGTLNVASPLEILEGLSRGLPESVHFTETLDKALKEWLKIQFRQEPHLPAGLFSRSLVDASFLLARINMPSTLEWLRGNLEKVRIWVRSFYQGKTLDVEGALLRTLALKQSDRSLAPVWYRLVDIIEPLPIHYYSLGILGLRCMPDSQGKKQRDINKEVFVGILRLASALQRRPDGKNLWMRELQGLMSIYPRSEKYWCDNFLPLRTGYNYGVYGWLASKIPAITEVKEKYKESKERTYYRVEEPPSKSEMDKILNLMNKVSNEDFREKVEDLRFRHRKVAQESGDSDTFVRFLCNIEKNIQSNYPTLAEEIVVEANMCAPHNPVTWTQLENIYRQQGDFEKGELMGWEAYHRFPENVYVYTGLAETLKAKGEFNEAEILYRETIDKFPENVVAWTGLAETIKEQERYPEAEKIYRDALLLKDSNIYVHNGLAYILKLQNNYTEADKYYNEAINMNPDNPVAYNGLAEVWRAHGDFKKAEELYSRSKDKFPNDAIAHVGLAVVLLRSKYEKAISLLEEAIDKFPNKKLASKILAEVKIQSGDYTGAEKVLIEAYEDEMFKTRSYPSKIKDESLATPKTKLKVSPDAEFVGIIPKAVPLPLDLSPIAVGFGNLYRNYGRRLQKKESKISKAEESYNLSSQWIEKALKQNPCNLYALAEKGWLMADNGDTSGAFSHFEHYSCQYPYNVALHLGLIRMKERQRSIEPDSFEWDNAGEKFPGFRQVFYLEQARYGLYSPNGYTIANLSKLQKELTLPQWTAKSEKKVYQWFVDVVKSKLFHNVELKNDYSTTIIEQLRINNEEYVVELDALAEVYVARK